MTKPRISVVMSVWNGSPYLREALDSVLMQPHQPLDVIAVNDGSTDDTADILRGYGDRIRVITQTNQGQAAGLVAGLAVASGDYLAFQDADDLWMPDKIERQCAALNDPSLEAAFCLSEQFVSPDIVTDRERFAPRGDPIMVGMTFPCLLIRRSAFERVGNIDPHSKTPPVEWFARARHAGLRYQVVQEVLHRRRLHPANFGRMHSGVRDASMLAALRAQIRRNRS